MNVELFTLEKALRLYETNESPALQNMKGCPEKMTETTYIEMTIFDDQISSTER